MHVADRVFTSDQLAEYLQVPAGTPVQWRNKRTGPRWFRAGKHVRYHEADVRAWIEAQHQEQAGTGEVAAR